jgi:hypothetical protein
MWAILKYRSRKPIDPPPRSGNWFRTAANPAPGAEIHDFLAPQTIPKTILS